LKTREMNKLKPFNRMIVLMAIAFLGGIVYVLLTKDATLRSMQNIFELKKIDEPPAGFVKVFQSPLTGTFQSNSNIYSFSVDKPSIVHFYLLSQYDGEKWLVLRSKKKLIGINSNELNLLKGDYWSASASLLLDSGSYQVLALNPELRGEIVLYISNQPADKDMIKRMVKIDRGDLNNPPPGYERVFYTNLGKLDVSSDFNAISLKVTNNIIFSFSVYSNIRRGKLSVRFKGSNLREIEIINEEHPVSDCSTINVNKGIYSFRVIAESADGELVIFISNQKCCIIQ